MKFFIYIFILSLSINFQAFSKYWKEIDNIPAPYNQNYWLDVFFYPTNSNYGWICGFNGRVIRTTNGGNTWVGSLVPNAYHLEHVHFPSLNIGYTSGPEGIWKSTDGGATWTNITPDDLFPDYWGCYFLDDDNGVLLGGGCIGGQSFYKTTDGGDSWTAFNANEPNSGLTDALLYPNGEGYASSSGIIWQTLDFGSSWSVFSRLGAKVWQEEISKFGISFLIPYSGYDCQGGGENGGAKFSIDNGLSWQDKNTGVSMFGSFMLSNFKGWACGDQDNVIYTSDGGFTWENKDCGLKYGNYDDMWFMDENNGWVVGAGVYKLAQSTYPISKDTILINNVCIGESMTDTIWINNNSFDRTTGRIIAPTSSSIHFLNTPNNFMIDPCAYYPVVINYTPQKDTTIQFNFNILVNEPASDQKNYVITVIMKTLVPTTYPQFSNIKIDSIRVGIDYSYDLKVFSESFDEYLVDYEKLSGSPNISISTKMPIKAFKNGNNLNFIIKTQDTGWVNARYRLKFDRCNFDTIIDIRAYAFSPIINSIYEINKTISCDNPILDTIEISNTGNDDLIITAYTSRPQNSVINVLGFINEKLPVNIKPKQSKKIVIEIQANALGFENYELLLINNDLTTIRGIKSPHKINLNVDYKKPIITTTKVIDFGEICPGHDVSLPIKLHNIGNMDGTVYIDRNLAEPFSFKFVGNPTSSIVRAEDSILSYIHFKSNLPGNYIDTIEFRTSPCNDNEKVIVMGKIIDTEIEIIPAMIDTMFRAGDTITVVVRMSAIERDVIIRKIYLNVPDADWYVNPKIVLPFAILKGQAAIFEVQFSTNKTSTLKTQLILENSSICDTLAFVNINLSTFSKFVTVGPNILDFGKNICKLDEKMQEIEIFNKGFINDTIVNISLDNNDFEILNLPQLPFELKVGDIYNLQVKYKPSAEGISNGKLKIETNSPGAQNFEINLQGSFFNSQINSNSTTIDFGYVESCQLNLIDSLIFSSIGLLNDTLDIINLPNDLFVEVNNSEKIIPIPSNSTNNLNFYLLTDRLEPGLNELKFSMQSRKCKQVFEITVLANLIKPRLLINPKPLDFGKMWIDEHKSMLLELNNGSNVDIFISKIEIDSDEFSYDGTPEFSIPANSLVNLPINFTANYEGKKQIPIIFHYNTKCQDSASGELLADVPKEEYGISLRIGNYISSPDSNFTISMILDSELKFLEPQKINFDLSFDRKLFFPQKILLKEGLNNADVSFNYSFGKLKIEVIGESAHDLFKNLGDIIFIKGAVLASVPDSTVLIFDKVEIDTPKDVDIDLINGSLKVVDFCHETAKFELQFIPSFNAKINSIVNENNLIFDISASKETEIEVKLTNLTGEIFPLGSFNIGTKEEKINSDISHLSNGIYFINFTNEYWSKTYKIIILK